jgi:hypothetical protein
VQTPFSFFFRATFVPIEDPVLNLPFIFVVSFSLMLLFSCLVSVAFFSILHA